MRANDAAPARVNTVMVALAWSVIHCPDRDGEDARVLATMVLDAAERAAAGGPGRA